MTGIELAAVISSVSSLVAAIGSAVAVVMTARNGRRIEQVHRATNGMHAEMMKVSGEAKYAEGRDDGERHPRKPKKE